jgi:hypothetical protein
MRRIFYSLIAVLTFFSSIYVSANEIEGFDLKNYVYDDEGNPVFIKVYIKSIKPLKTKFSNQDWNDLPLQQDSWQQLMNQVSQEDQRGTYLIIPIKKKKGKDADDDKDESNWECPYCGTDNPATRNTCSNRECPLYRRAGRDWHKN